MGVDDLYVASDPTELSGGAQQTIRSLGGRDVDLGVGFWAVMALMICLAGAVGGMLLALINRRLTFKNLRDTMQQTVQLTSMVFIILVGATAFSMVFTALNGDTLVDQFLVSLPGGKWGFLFFTMLTIFFLGFFIDFIEITFIVVPFITPIALHFFGPEMMTWFAVVIAMNLQSSFLTPPFGFALFYLKGVAPPSIKTAHIYRGILPFVFVQIAALLLLVAFPRLVTWLPTISSAK